MPKQKRDRIFIWPSWITKLVAGEDQCFWKIWFKAHYMHDRKPSDFNLATWTIQHNKLLHQRRDALERLGFKVFIEEQNEFKFNLNVQIGDDKVAETLIDAEKQEPMQIVSITVSGKADLVAIGETEDDKITGKMHPVHLVEDCKTGNPKTSDHVQVILYMLWLPLAIPKYKDVKFHGCIVYKVGVPNVDIPPSGAEDMSIKSEIWDTIKKVVGNENNCRKVPSRKECNWCDITSADCPERIDYN